VSNSEALLQVVLFNVRRRNSAVERLMRVPESRRHLLKTLCLMMLQVSRRVRVLTVS
jgi:hypothetical protein